MTEYEEMEREWEYGMDVSNNNDTKKICQSKCAELKNKEMNLNIGEKDIECFFLSFRVCFEKKFIDTLVYFSLLLGHSVDKP